MIFLNPLPNLFWFLLLLPIIIFIINNRISKTVKFSSINLLENLKSNQINRIKLLNILLLIIRTLIILFILLIIMKPNFKDSLLEPNVMNNKIINLILIDDSFSNSYGFINGVNQSTIINDIVDGISKSYPINSKIKIFSLNRGLIFDGFNNNIFIKNILDYDYSDLDFQKLIDYEYVDYHKNIHIISRFNDNSIDQINDFYNDINNGNINQSKFIFHALPQLLNNQYIKEVRLINNLNQNFSSYEIVIGNNSDKDIDIVLLANKNSYNYDSKLYIDNTVPIYRNTLSLPANSIIADTMIIELDLKESFELFFELNRYENNNNLELIDDRIEDNHYSYSLNIPKNINVSVLYNDINAKDHISSILNSFKINTKSIDSNFYKIDYTLTQGLQKYYKIDSDKNVLLFLGYDIFDRTNSDIIFDFLKREKSQVIIFPTKDNIEQKKYSLKLDDGYSVDFTYNENPLNSYDTVNFNKEFIFDSNILENNNFKISKYFSSSKHSSNSLLDINYNESIWSRHKIGNGTVDLFGVFIKYGNNFFDDQIIYSIPLMYKIIIDEKINSKNNNLLMNRSFSIKNKNMNKFKFFNLKNDSTILFDSFNQVVLSKDLMALIFEGEIESLYSFNPDSKNFDFKNSKLNFPYTLINYDSSNDFKTFFSDTLRKSDLTKYFIYILFILIILEMALSNARPPKSD